MTGHVPVVCVEYVAEDVMTGDVLVFDALYSRELCDRSVLDELHERNQHVRITGGTGGRVITVLRVRGRILRCVEGSWSQEQ